MLTIGGTPDRGVNNMRHEARSSPVLTVHGSYRSWCTCTCIGERYIVSGGGGGLCFEVLASATEVSSF